MGEEKLLWSDLKNAIVDAEEALIRLSTFGMAMKGDLFDSAIRNALNELSMWHVGMDELAERGVQDIDRDAVISAYHEHIMPLLGGWDITFDITSEEDDDE